MDGAPLDLLACQYPDTLQAGSRRRLISTSPNRSEMQDFKVYQNVCKRHKIYNINSSSFHFLLLMIIKLHFLKSIVFDEQNYFGY